jgi:DNA polymerase-3 subunit epsilon
VGSILGLEGLVSFAPDKPITHSLILSLDTETTGLDLDRDRIVELGVRYFYMGEPFSKPMNIRINPEIRIPEGASAVHGIYDRDVAKSPTFSQILPRLKEHLDGSVASQELGRKVVPVLCGYNIQEYDTPLLNRQIREAGDSLQLADDRILDPIWISKAAARRSSSRLGDVCAKYGISIVNAHAAWADADAAVRVLMAMVRCGHLVDNVEKALFVMKASRVHSNDDRAHFQHYIYTDRTVPAEPVLRIGFGKHQGVDLADLPVDYLRYLMKLDDMPTHVKSVFRAIHGAKTILRATSE